VYFFVFICYILFYFSTPSYITIDHQNQLTAQSSWGAIFTWVILALFSIYISKNKEFKISTDKNPEKFKRWFSLMIDAHTLYILAYVPLVVIFLIWHFIDTNQFSWFVKARINGLWKNMHSFFFFYKLALLYFLFMLRGFKGIPALGQYLLYPIDTEHRPTTS